MIAVRWYLRYALSYRDVEELLAKRGIKVDQVMQPDRGQAGVVDQAVEQLAEPVGFDRVATLVGEDGPAYLALDGGGGAGR